MTSANIGRMAEEIFDVVLQSTGWFEAELIDWEKFPPPKGDFHLDEDFWIGKLPHGIKSAQVFDACEPAGFEFRPYRQFGCRYAFCRKVEPPSPDHFTWDHDNRIGETLFLSRLIHPTTVAPHYSARIIFEDGVLSSIVPGRVQGYATYVWIVATEWRDWLSQPEAEHLRDSMPRYIVQARERVQRARSHIDHAFHAFYLDQRTASIVSAFESLLKVGRNRATAQFTLRVPALAQKVGFAITPDEAWEFYDDRSVFVHGSQLKYTHATDELVAQYNKFENALRCALLRASTDSQFANLFSTDGAIVGAFGALP